ncbi:MAG: hypothetical protein ACOX6G_04325 [Christensenellales bacterium]|jgi:heme/copper-type cytochrome/quinol oxidase subunit 4|nr:DUF1206 domain-containing protein [Clostridiales bacterium]
MKNKNEKRFPFGTVLFVILCVALLLFGLYWVLEGINQPVPIIPEGLIV